MRFNVFLTNFKSAKNLGSSDAKGQKWHKPKAIVSRLEHIILELDSIGTTIRDTASITGAQIIDSEILKKIDHAQKALGSLQTLCMLRSGDLLPRFET